MNQTLKSRKMLCILLTVVLLAVPVFTLTAAAETAGETAPAASPYLQKKLSFLETLYGDAEGTGVKVLADWVNSQTDGFFNGDMTSLKDSDLPEFSKMIRYTIPIIFEYALSPEFGDSSAAMYRSQVCFDNFSKILEAAAEKDTEIMTQIMLEIYPDFVKAFCNAFGDDDPASVKNLGFFYASVRKKLTAEIAFSGEEKAFMTDVERDKAALTAFYVNFPDAGKTGLALFPQAVLSELMERAILNPAKSVEILKCVCKSQIIFEDLAKCVDVVQMADTDQVIGQFSEIVADFQSGINKAFDENIEETETPAADIFTNTLFRVSLMCSDSHGHTFGAPVYLYNADCTECTAIAFCECGTSVTETVKLKKEGNKLIAVFDNSEFETQSMDAADDPVVTEPEIKNDPIVIEEKTEPEEKKDSVNSITVIMIVLAAVFFVAAVAFAVLFFLNKKKPV